ncbi:CsbD family protein [Mycobacterium sp. GA-2829]|uniref:CsbD family protein n=1 Tax=Mycobacterium sp. GA-2829 TaxID=1772283 RepID=UPI00073FB81C|nr:CsbD family protein [Mycobacterium sp. GA-2829]KUI28798.1 general stress protein CsbD [Mycobacterium sp. GA-2829]
MSVGDKARNKLQQLQGRMRAATGEAMGDPNMRARGRGDERIAHLKDAGEKVKDAFRSRRRPRGY